MCKMFSDLFTVLTLTYQTVFYFYAHQFNFTFAETYH